MSDETLRASLPEIYGPLLPAAFDRPAVHESRATCFDCQMCDRGTVPAELKASYFRPDTKCCTYHPSLPNYLVGSILADDRPLLVEGKRRIREQIASRLGTTPQRLMPSKKWTILYRAASDSSFGRSSLLRCPYLDGEERCSIWPYREVVCATYYCKFDGGVRGSRFWKALKAYLNFVEESLSTWAARQVDAAVRDPRENDSPSLSLAEFEGRPPEPATYRATWGKWVDREEEFYLACAERVRGMDRAAFVKLVESTSAGRERLEALERAISALAKAPEVPERVALNRKLRVLPVADGVVLTMPYNPFDSIKIETELHDVLKTFQYERTVAETRKLLADEKGVELEDALVSMFAMHDILVPPPEGGFCEAVGTAASMTRRCAAVKKSDVAP